MLCKEIMDIIERDYPRDYALEWDNVGLLAGRDDREVCRIYLALDATDEVIRAATEHKADMLITHHPLIFGGMRRITNQDFIGKRILELIRSDISYYAMHTNYDVLGMAGQSGRRLGLKQQEALEVTCKGEPDGQAEGIGRIGVLEAPVTLREFCEEVKKAFQLESVRVFGNLEGKAEKIAICPGSGKSVIKTALKGRADVLVTGDIGHHEGIDAAAQGMAVIDAGHYGIEHIFVEDMGRYLIGRLEDVEIITAPVRHPYTNV